MAAAVEVVAFDDAVHVYEPGDPAAVIVETAALAAQVDVLRTTLTAEQWARVQVTPAVQQYPIHDHRA
ncbi:hypothetical protein M2302_002260 [Micromonospora sp. A200]|uniref:hypothetical protein n=1 Tax=Micromonospora sp. A200 TaxID=2940568 RepID=UPI002474E2D0|nr:hypothetical protein [Micromonospora sp. A200]MDH6462085.1 hypothetical protein [Micromonospora sp. A200]